MLDAAIPSLKVDGMVLAPKAAPIDLRFLLYKGGASLDRRWGRCKLRSGQLGHPLMERLPLLREILLRWQAAVADKSLSDRTIETEFRSLRLLVAFGDLTNSPFTKDNLRRLYLDWAAHVAARSNVKPISKYYRTVFVARVIGPLLGISSTRLQLKTKIRRPKYLGISGAKENLQETGDFIQLLLETIEQLPIDVIRGPLPVVLRYGEAKYQVNCGWTSARQPIENVVTRSRSHLALAAASRERSSKFTSNTKRTMLINLRLEAEMLVFINQTSCNLTQALQLTGSKFSYQTDGNYVLARPWKNRAKHVVELRIEKGYRPHFEAFLKWRAAIFPGDPDGLTLPFVRNDGDMAMQRTGFSFRDTRKLCKAIGKPFVPPSQLRDTVGNFFKRRKSRQLASELLSNSEKTFREHYEAPDHQRAAAELVNFFGDLEGMAGEAVGPGGCQKAEPEQVADAPKGAPKPDCESGAGCLFCDKNRDLRSFDHAWNLASFHHLTLLQFNGDRTALSPRQDHPAQITAERAAAKLDALAVEDGECAKWVVEARLRVQEGRYHPHYTHTFESLEGVA